MIINHVKDVMVRANFPIVETIKICKWFSLFNKIVFYTTLLFSIIFPSKIFLNFIYTKGVCLHLLCVADWWYSRLDRFFKMIINHIKDMMVKANFPIGETIKLFKWFFLFNSIVVYTTLLFSTIFLSKIFS
jgi:hypothetical protein